MASTIPNQAKVGKIPVQSRIALTKGAFRDSSGGKQLFDSGLLFDSGIYFDRWGSGSVQSERAKVSFIKE